MKKYKILLVVFIVLFCGSFLVLSNTMKVDAANNECSAGYTKETYMNNISYNVSGNVVTYTGAKGLLYSTSFDATKRAVAEDGSFSFTIPEEEMSSRIIVTFYLASSDGVCDADKEVGNNTFYANTSARNQLYDDALCVNYRNKWSDNETMKEAVPYCFTEEVFVQYSYNEVSSWIKEAEELYEMQTGGTSVPVDPDYTNVDDVKKTDKLVCDAFSDKNYETMHKYSHTETETVNNCTTTCVEEIEVNFSDPVATQPGMCFQYLIEIKSKVTCDSKYTAPKPGKPAVCVPTAKCVASNGYVSDKGGPSEDFDACIEKCDGGEYSQKCIDKCYTEVYESDEYSTDIIATPTRQTTFEPIASVLTFDTTYLDGSKKATQIANGCLTPWNVTSLNQAGALYQQHQKDPGGKYVGKKWVPSSSGCPSSIGQFYFRSLSATRQTIREAKGWYSDAYGQKTYGVGSNGFLIRTKINGYTNVCNDTCTWINKCGSNTVLTEYLANKQYQEALEKWETEKAACESKSATCSNESTDYKIVVDNLDKNDSKEDTDKSDWQEDFTSSQKLNSTNVTGKFPSMVILTDGSCEDGKDDPWNYHNIITFPGTWINNKTGKPVHSIQPGHEDFYTYVGNEYCTKLDSVPVNTAWYDWKVNQNGNSSSLTDSQKEEINDSIDMNIRGHIDNYGYFGWNFDVSCFYAVDYPGSTCSPSDPNWPDCDDGKEQEETPINNYEFRSISLDNLFPNSTTKTSSSKDVIASNLINEVESLRNNNVTAIANNTREIGFNWTCAATNLENLDYLVQPVTVMNEIQRLGDSIYEGNEYLDYHIRLTSDTIKKVRQYNDSYDSYTQPTSIDKMLSVDSDNKTPGITVYNSYLLHKVLDSNELLKSGIIGCNNDDNRTCPRGEAAIDKNTSCYNEYIAQSAVLKGGK